MSEAPTIRTGRLKLRPFALSDAPAVQRLAGVPEVADMTTHIPYPYADGMAEAWIRTHQEQMERGEVSVFAVTDAASDKLLGAVGLTLDPRQPCAELGYWIGKPFWGCGYATEAVRAILLHGFQQLGLRRIHACHFARNPASGRVMQKAGMRRQGEGSRYVDKTAREEPVVIYAADSSLAVAGKSVEGP